jgi:hypothetical protein
MLWVKSNDQVRVISRHDHSQAPAFDITGDDGIALLIAIHPRPACDYLRDLVAGDAVEAHSVARVTGEPYWVMGHRPAASSAHKYRPTVHGRACPVRSSPHAEAEPRVHGASSVPNLGRIGYVPVIDLT